jgi:hypothetical protein
VKNERLDLRRFTREMVAHPIRSHVLWAASLVTLACATPQPPSPQMSFFVTSRGLGDGGNLGGIGGADRHCQQLASAVGSSRIWRAYLSAPEPAAVNARDRIGTGPWINAAGIEIAASLDQLHRDNSMLTRETLLTEQRVKVSTQMHDMLTGSTAEGTLMPGARDATCHGWASHDGGGARVGHHDRAVSIEQSRSWNSAHTTDGCSARALDANLGAGLSTVSPSTGSRRRRLCPRPVALPAA